MSRDYTNVTGYIYKITSPNDKIYIGQTVNVSNRKSNYRRNYFKSQTKLWNSCQKYNWSPLDTFEIIESCLCGENKSYLNEREIYWISFYNSCDLGLNCNLGGDGNLGYSPTEETRQKLSKANTGKVHSKEHRDKISLSRKIRYEKKGNPLIGTKRSDETKQKISEAQIGKKLSQETKDKISKALKKPKTTVENMKGFSNSAKRVSIQGIIYESALEASIALNLHKSSMHRRIHSNKEEYKDWYIIDE